MQEEIGSRESSRRRFLQDAAAAGERRSRSAGLPATASAARRRKGRRLDVAVLGGGMAGLAAAHELAERGFRVHVYERNALGGKARSLGVPRTAGPGRRPLPGEHGFRFFPGFYHHVPDSMRRIPVRGNKNGVWDNFRDATETKSPRTRRAGGRHPVRGGARPRGGGLAGGAPEHPGRGAGQAAGRAPRRGRVLRQPPARVPHQQRPAPLRPVGAHHLVGLRARRGQVRRVQEGDRPRAHPQPGGGQGDGGQHAHHRQHGRGVRHELPEPRQRRLARPRAQRPHQRGVDQAVGAPPAPDGRALPRGPGGGGARAAQGQDRLRARPRPPRPQAQDRRRLVRVRDAGRARPQAVDAAHPAARPQPARR